jgi:hypothetical protein
VSYDNLTNLKSTVIYHYSKHILITTHGKKMHKPKANKQMN